MGIEQKTYGSKILFFSLPLLFFLIIFPNIGVLLLLCTIWCIDLKNNNTYNFFVLFILLYLAITLATKELTGDGNDYITYFYNTKYYFYPTWAEDKFDFLFWYVASIIMGYISGDNKFIFFVAINLISSLPFYTLFKYIRENNAVTDSSKILVMFFILFITSFSFWNLYGNYIRQAWILSYSLGLIVAMLDRRYVYAIFFSVILISSHSTGVIFLAIIIVSVALRKIDLKKMSFYAVVICLICISTPIFSIAMRFMTSDASSKLYFYSTWSGSDFGETASFRLVLAYIVLYVLDFIGFHKSDRNNPLYHHLYLIFIILMVGISIVSEVTKVVERLYYPAFVLFFIILSLQYSTIIRRFNKHSQIIINISLVIFGLPILLYSLYSSLYYNIAYFSGSLSDFLLSNILDYPL